MSFVEFPSGKENRKMSGDASGHRILMISHLFTGHEPWLLGSGKSAGMPGVTKFLEGLVTHGFRCTWLILTDENREGDSEPIKGVDALVRRIPRAIRWLRSRRPGCVFEPLSFIPMLCWSMGEVIKSTRTNFPDLLYVEGSRGFPWVGFIWSKLMRIQMVTRFYGTPLGRLLDRPHARLRMIATWFLDSISFLAPTALMVITDDGTRGYEVARLFHSPRGGKRLLFLRNGIDHSEAESRTPLPQVEGIPKSRRLVWVSRFDHWKRVDRSIRAMGTIVENDPEATLCIIGYGSAEEELRKLVVDLGLENRVFFLGRLPMEEVRSILSHCSIYLSTYDYLANVSNTMFEAMAEGCCVVTLDEVSTRRLITDGLTGYLVDPKISDDDLGVKILERIRNFKGSRKAGRRGRKAAGNIWTWQERMDFEISTISHLIESRRLRRD